MLADTRQGEEEFPGPGRSLQVLQKEVLTFDILVPPAWGRASAGATVPAP